MADDPRQEVLAKRLAADQNDDAHWTGYLREAGLHIAALNALDPLCALLADEDRAVEAMTAAWFESLHPRRWAHCSERVKEHHRRHFRAVLAALREVADGG